MTEAGDKAVRRAAEAANGQPEFPAQFVQVVAAAVLQLAPLEQVPNALIRIELGRVGGQTLKMQPGGRASGEEGLHRLAAVDRRAVPQHEQLAANLAQELTEEGDHRLAPKRGRLDAGEEPAIGRDRADDAEVVMGEGRAEHRCLAHRRPGAGDEGEQIEAGFIYEEDRALLSTGFASRAGHVSCDHAPISASVR